MALARDTFLESATFTTTSPHTFTYTPIGTPRGVVLFVVYGSVTDLITGTVSYGGVAMTRVPTNGHAAVTTEPGSVVAYTLGASIPTGAQTVSIAHTGSADVKIAYVGTLTAGADTEIAVSAKQVLESAEDPSVALDSGADSALRYGALFGGEGAPGNYAALSGMEAGAAGSTHDFGNFVAFFGQQTSPSTGSFTFGFASTGNESSALIGVAIREVTGGATQNLTGALFTKAPTFFTGAITATRALTGVLFTKAPTFPTGVVSAIYTIAGGFGGRFQKAPTFFTGAVSLAASPQTVNGVLFTKAPTFPQGAVTSTYALTGTLFVKVPTFFTGTVSSGTVTLNGALFTKAPTFPQGAITTGAVTLTGVLFQKAPTFPIGTVTAGAYPLTGSLFVKAPTFFTGTIGQAGTLFGTLFQKAPTFFTGSLAQGGPSFWQPDPAGWTANPSAFVRVGRYGPSPWGAELSGQRFEKAPTFPVGIVS